MQTATYIVDVITVSFLQSLNVREKDIYTPADVSKSFCISNFDCNAHKAAQCNVYPINMRLTDARGNLTRMRYELFWREVHDFEWARASVLLSPELLPLFLFSFLVRYFGWMLLPSLFSHYFCLFHLIAPCLLCARAL